MPEETTRDNQTEMRLYLTISGPLSDLPLSQLQPISRLTQDIEKIAATSPLSEGVSYRNINVEIEDGVVTVYRLRDWGLDENKSAQHRLLGEKEFSTSDLDRLSKQRS